MRVASIGPATPGGVAERSNALVLKTRVRASGPRVRIPPPPLASPIDPPAEEAALRHRRRRAFGLCRSPQHDGRPSRLAGRDRPGRAPIDDRLECRRESALRVRHRPAHLRAVKRHANPGSRLEAGAAHGRWVLLYERQLGRSMTARGGASQASRRDPGRCCKDDQGQNRSGSAKSRPTRWCSHVVPPATRLAR